MSLARVGRGWRWVLPPLALGGLGPWLGAARTDPAQHPSRRRVIEIRAMAFHPAVDTVQVGDTVVWVNGDLVPHTATPRAGGGWRAGVILPDSQAVAVIDRAGQVAYRCELHPVMEGRLVVRRRE